MCERCHFGWLVAARDQANSAKPNISGGQAWRMSKHAFRGTGKAAVATGSCTTLPCHGASRTMTFFQKNLSIPATTCMHACRQVTLIRTAREIDLPRVREQALMTEVFFRQHSPRLSPDSRHVGRPALRCPRVLEMLRANDAFTNPQLVLHGGFIFYCLAAKVTLNGPRGTSLCSRVF